MNLPIDTRLIAGLLLAWPTLAVFGQDLAKRTEPSAEVESALSRQSSGPRKNPLPPELVAESAIYLQRRLNLWSEADAGRELGKPSRRRDALEKGTVIGEIFAYRDPSKRYREFELLFDKRTRILRSAFIYPWQMTWEQCRALWGEDVSTTKVADGNLFLSYQSRRLDVLMDKSGKVINLGIY